MSVVAVTSSRERLARCRYGRGLVSLCWQCCLLACAKRQALTIPLLLARLTLPGVLTHRLFRNSLTRRLLMKPRPQRLVTLTLPCQGTQTSLSLRSRRELLALRSGDCRLLHTRIRPTLALALSPVIIMGTLSS